MDEFEDRERDKFGVARTFKYVLWRWSAGPDGWRGEMSGNDRDALLGHAMAYGSEKVVVLPMGDRPKERR